MTTELVFSLLVAIVSAIGWYFQYKGKAAEAKKAEKAAELIRSIAAGVEKHKVSTGDKTVTNMIKTVATDAGVQEDLHEMLVEMGYSKPKDGV